MLKRFFVKYARAVSNERERQSLYWLYCIRAVALALFFLFCIAVIAEVAFIGEDISADGTGVFYNVFGITLLLWFFSALALVCFSVIFRSSYRNILKREPAENEMPEVVSYRKKTAEAGKSLFKSIRWAVVLLVIGAVCMVVLIFTDIALNPDTEELTLLSDIGIGAFAVSLGIFLFTLLFVQTKRSSEGKTAELETEREAKIIDEAQGRRHSYSLAADSHAQTYRYLFPNSNLRSQVESLNSRSVNITFISVFLSCIVGTVIVLIFFTPLVFDYQLTGYAFPVCMTVIFLGIAPAIPFSVRQNALKKQQKAELEAYPIYEKNLAVFRKYEAFSKGKGRVLYIFILISFVLAYTMAIVFPDKLWSLIAVIPLFAGLFVNKKLIAALRKEALPLENEIDRIGRQTRFRLAEGEDPEDGKVSYFVDALLTETGGKAFQCYFYFGTTYPLFLGMDNETKKIGELASAFFRDDAKRKPITPPESFTVGALYVKGEETYPPFYRQEIAFGRECAYDPGNRILQFGVPLPAVPFCKILSNAYVQLSDEGFLSCILITDIVLPEANQTVGLTQFLEPIKQIYQIPYTAVQKEYRGKYYTLSFCYRGYEIAVETNKERVGGDYTYITVKKTPKSEPMPFWMLYAYYEDKLYNIHCGPAELTEYLTLMKSYIEGDKVFYVESDLPNQKRYFYHNGVKKEISFTIDADFETEMKKWFGDSAEKITRWQKKL